MNIEYNQLIDEIISYDKNGSIICRSLVPDQAPVFEGHFPHYPILPGVLLVETMAQASGYLYFMENDFNKMVVLSSIKSAKFRNFVGPSQTISINAKIIHNSNGFILTKCSISNGDKVATAELFLSIINFPNDEMRLKLKETMENKMEIFRDRRNLY